MGSTRPTSGPRTAPRTPSGSRGDRVALIAVATGLALLPAATVLQVLAVLALGGALVAWWVSGLLLARLPRVDR
jgi:hypothetical protein